MKKLKSSLINMVVVLTTISVIAGAALAAINKYTEKKISEIKSEKLAQSIKEVLNVPASEQLTVEDETVNDFIFHKTEKGTAVESTQNGFGGKLKILVGFDKEGNILGYSILETQETPGLGAKASEWFQKDGKGCIIGKNPYTTRMGVKKGDEGDIDAITASTITSRAFLNAVQAAYQALFHGNTDGVTSATQEANVESCETVKPEETTSDTIVSKKAESSKASNKTKEDKKASTDGNTAATNVSAEQTEDKNAATTDATTAATAQEQ
ncbi:MAG: RnfABCDGE type electron transport complex subunit G [Bacteroidaceae bacterium]|nr:RnfABCDGE type electron transport complex subunit G [Bacteroidaceae bacterium]